jgi:hypothetical protein
VDTLASRLFILLVEAGLRTLSTINTRGDRGLVAWSEE